LTYSDDTQADCHAACGPPPRTGTSRPRPSAQLRLARAQERLDAARKIAAIDVEVAYVTAYDVMRLAVAARGFAEIEWGRREELDDLDLP
jgi:hypothetical protein